MTLHSHSSQHSMANYIEMQFIHTLKKAPAERTQEDLDVIYSYLHSLESIAGLRDLPHLRVLCKTARYEHRDANDILYCRGELASCWYILLSGSVFIDGSMYLPHTSFGKRTAGCSRRTNECLILEHSEMIVIDYPEVQLMKSSRQPASATGNIDHLLHLEQNNAGHFPRGRYPSDDTPRQLPTELQSVQNVLQRSEQYIRSDSVFKRHSHASDTSSAYSGSDVMQSSLEDQEVDLSGLRESLVDSDDEEGYIEQPESLIVRDTVRECLEKEPSERTESDIEVLLEFMQHLPAFANMTLATRRALCAVMVFAVVDKAGTIVMNNGEELDSWSVILNGHVEIERPNGTIEHLHMGDSFGITPTTEKLYHNGVMRTKMDDCQFVCIEQSDYYRILHQGEENTQRIEEGGEVVLVTEHRCLDAGSRKGNIVIKGTPQRLMKHLIDEHSAVDPTFVEDFLLTYRTFLKTPQDVADNLLEWFSDTDVRDRVTRVVLLWVNNHFNDFESDSCMSEFLEKFEMLLDKARMGGQLRLLNIACAAKARARTITLTRVKREEILHFSVLGGLERGCGIFISKVEKNSKASEVGLKRGDQILEVNNQNFEHISHNRALEILRGTTHLSITVKSNLLAFKEMLMTPDNSPIHASKKDHHLLLVSNSDNPRRQLSVPELGCQVAPIINSPHKDRKDPKERGFMSTGHKTKIRKALMKFNFLPRNVNSDTQLNHIDDLAYGKARKGSSSSSANSSPIHTPRLTHSTSNPDLTSVGQTDEFKSDYPEHVLKVYKADQTCKYFLVHRETTAREVVMLALKEFGISDPSSNYSLCEVTVESEGFVKQKRLPDQMSNLPDRISLNGRYYLKNNMSTDTLVPDEMSSELTKEGLVNFLQLNTTEIAAQLTLRDFQMFQDIEPTEYMDDLFELGSTFGTPHLALFSELVNKEMFWVITEVCSEINIVRRMKILKHFIKIARHSKECKNFNSMFAIISGLGHGSVSRLRNTWDRLPTKYVKMFEDLQDLMDPSRNMSKYRNLVNSDIVHPPLIPFFPVVKKDLTFIHLGNDSKVDGLVNFEKLRMIAKEIRHVCNMSSAQYDLDNMYFSYGTSQAIFSAFAGTNASAVATLRRKRRSATLPNPKKMFEEAQMVRRVRSYLQNMKIVDDESKLTEMSQQCEPPAGVGNRKRDPSPSPVLAIDTQKAANLGPKFGAESPEAVRKLMALSDKVRPHNPKHNPPSRVLQAHSPAVNRKPPLSPKFKRTASAGSTGSSTSTLSAPPIAAITLSPESSSVVSLSNMTLRKSATSSSVGSTESNSPTSSVGSTNQPQGSETDSGHNSVVSSNYDSHSTGSHNSAGYSPPAMKRYPPPPSSHHPGRYHHPGPPGQHPLHGLTTHPPQHHPMAAPPQYQYPPPPASMPMSAPAVPSQQHRPQLPQYHEVVHRNKAYGHYVQQHYSYPVTEHPPLPPHPHPSSRGWRPPLPDYEEAIRMSRRKHVVQHGRSLSHDSMMSNSFSNGGQQRDDLHDALLDDDDTEEEEQVSAV